MVKLDYFEEIESLKVFYKLKEIIRYKGINNESVAEHVYSSIVLAKYFLKKVDENLDENIIFNLILYHDIVEIFAGDVCLGDDKKLENKKENESNAINTLKEKISNELFEEFKYYFDEFEKNKTREAKFANAIDKIDPYFECWSKPEITKKLKISAKQLKGKKEKYFKEFDVIYDFYIYLTDYFKKNNYLVED